MFLKGLYRHGTALLTAAPLAAASLAHQESEVVGPGPRPVDQFHPANQPTEEGGRPPPARARLRGPGHPAPRVDAGELQPRHRELVGDAGDPPRDPRGPRASGLGGVGLPPEPVRVLGHRGHGRAGARRRRALPQHRGPGHGGGGGGARRLRRRVRGGAGRGRPLPRAAGLGRQPEVRRGSRSAGAPARGRGGGRQGRRALGRARHGLHLPPARRGLLAPLTGDREGRLDPGRAQGEAPAPRARRPRRVLQLGHLQQPQGRLRPGALPVHGR